MGMTWFKALAVFGQELMTNPRPMGAACPSSPELARRVARMVGKSPHHFVLEIGAGTGAITAALLRDCVPPQRLIACKATIKPDRSRSSNAIRTSISPVTVEKISSTGT